MVQSSNERELPPGYRSNIAYAVHADDPPALLKYLKACNEVDRSVLATDQGGQVPPDNHARNEDGYYAYSYQFTPWSYREVNQSLIKRVDNILYDHLKPINRIDEKDTLHTVALAVAANVGSFRIVSLLMSDRYRNDVNPGYDNDFAFRGAIMRGHLKVAKLLLSDPRVDPTTSRNQSIDYACQTGQLEIATLLLRDSRVIPGIDTIGLASKNGHTEIVQLLLDDKRVDPSYDDNEAICEAIFEQHIQVVKLLLADKRVDPSVYDVVWPALKTADTEVIVRSLLCYL